MQGKIGTNAIWVAIVAVLAVLSFVFFSAVNSDEQVRSIGILGMKLSGNSDNAHSEVSCSYEYGSWGECVNGVQRRDVVSGDKGCTGNPLIERACSISRQSESSDSSQFFELSSVTHNPSISSLEISPNGSINEGALIRVVGTATASNSSCIVRHRMYVTGSQGGAWTDVGCQQSVSLDTMLNTSYNPNNFYGAYLGIYTLRWEVQSQAGESTVLDKEVRIVNTSSGWVAPISNRCRGIPSPSDYSIYVIVCEDVSPAISQLALSTNTVKRNDLVRVEGLATAHGSTCISKHRLYIVGSQGGAWTDVGCQQSVSLDTMLNTSYNPNSFYGSPTGVYTLRWEVQNHIGDSRIYNVNVKVLNSTEDLGGQFDLSHCKEIPSPSNASIVVMTCEETLPIISQFFASPTSVSEGNSVTVTGVATASNSSCIVRHRMYVTGSQGGAWTDVGCQQSVSLSSSIPTSRNPKSFYGSPTGVYTLRWEVQNHIGETSAYETNVAVNSAAQ